MADQSVGAARRLRAGDLVGAMDLLRELADPLGEFLFHLQACGDVLADLAPRLGAACGQYEQRLFDLLDRVQRGLDDRDLVGLTLTLEHALAPALRDFQRFDAPICSVLSRPPGALAA